MPRPHPPSSTACRRLARERAKPSRRSRRISGSPRAVCGHGSARPTSTKANARVSAPMITRAGGAPSRGPGAEDGEGDPGKAGPSSPTRATTARGDFGFIEREGQLPVTLLCRSLEVSTSVSMSGGSDAASRRRARRRTQRSPRRSRDPHPVPCTYGSPRVYKELVLVMGSGRALPHRAADAQSRHRRCPPQEEALDDAPRPCRDAVGGPRAPGVLRRSSRRPLGRRCHRTRNRRGKSTWRRSSTRSVAVSSAGRLRTT